MKSSIKKNLLYQSFYEIIIIILPLLTSPYISRVLGAENLGIFSYTHSVAYYFQLFGMLGIKFYGNRKIAQVRDDQEKLNRTYSELLTIHIIMGIVACLAYGIYVLFFAREYRIYSIIQGLMVLATLFDVSWFFFGIENFKLNVTRNTIIKIISVICIFLFVREKSDLWKYVAIMATSQAAGECIMFSIVPKYVKYAFPGWVHLKEHVKPLLVLFIPVIATSLFKYMDKIMLGSIGNAVELGLYDNAEKILNIPLSIILAFGSVMLPKMSNLIAKGNIKQSDNYIKLSINYMLCIAIAMGAGMAGVAHVFAPIFWGKEFLKSAELISLLSITLPFTTLANIVRNQDLIPNNKDRQYTYAIVAGACVNLVINWLLIPKFQSYGVSIGTVVAEITVCLVQFKFAKKEFNYKKYIINALWFFIPGILMYFIVIKIGERMGTHIYTLIIQIGLGALLYSIITTIHLIRIKDEQILNIIEKVKGRLK